GGFGELFEGLCLQCQFAAEAGCDFFRLDSRQVCCMHLRIELRQLRSQIGGQRLGRRLIGQELRIDRSRLRAPPKLPDQRQHAQQDQNDDDCKKLRNVHETANRRIATPPCIEHKRKMVAIRICRWRSRKLRTDILGSAPAAPAELEMLIASVESRTSGYAIARVRTT